MTDPITPLCYDTQNLFSTAGNWTFCIQSGHQIKNHSPQLIDQQNGYLHEISKLLIHSGTKMVDCLKHQNQYFTIDNISMQPQSKTVAISVTPYSTDPSPEVVETYAQSILAMLRHKPLSTPAAKALAFIALNDCLFQIDPARLTFLVEEAQYNACMTDTE